MPRISKKTTHHEISPRSKCPTGIKGFDEVTGGGLPRNRTTVISGGPGSGKTLLGIDFLVKGAAQYHEPGVFISFEESVEELYEDMAALNLDLKKLVSQKKIVVKHIILERRDVEESVFNLEGIFVHLEQAIESIGAKRVVLDTIESLFAGLSNISIFRVELKRLFRWLKRKQVTAIVTGEPGKDSFTRHGLEEFASDCIVLLDNRVREEVAVRRVRVVKYRGSGHGTNEYPFVIDENGLSVIPITSAAFEQPGTHKRVSTGIPSLDHMFRERGFTRGSAVLISGTAGTGKTSLAAAFALASCKRGERSLFVSYEESSGQLFQNMSSIGFHFEPWTKKGLLKVVSTRPSHFGLEVHLLDLYKILRDFKPKAVVVDPLTSLLPEGSSHEVRSMITRMIDMLKADHITSFFTSLVSSSEKNDATSGEIGVSSLIDTWIVVRELEEAAGRRRIRGLYIVKSRGTAHSSDIRKLVLSDDGIRLLPMDLAPDSGQKKTDNKANLKKQK